MTNNSRTETIKQIEELIKQWEFVKNSSEKEILIWETKALKTIFPHRFDDLNIITNDMVEILNKNDKFWCPGSDDPNYNLFFSKTKFNSFMDYFTRELSLEKKLSILEKTSNYSMAIPNECYIESLGEMKEVNKIISLKKPCEDVKNSMSKIGIYIENYSFINQKLLLTFYHRIHSPINGIIERIIPYPKEEKIFGENTLWILDINTLSKGHIYFMLIGESEIQDFHFKIKEGQEIKTFDEIGNFNWGSQTVLFYDHNKFDYKTKIQSGKHFFAGDKII